MTPNNPPGERPDPRLGPGLEARQEQARRQAMIDLIEASRGGGLLSFGRQLPYAERQEILEKGEAAEAWQKLYANAPTSVTGGFARIGLLFAVLAILFFGLILLAG